MNLTTVRIQSYSDEIVTVKLYNAPEKLALIIANVTVSQFFESMI